jgi:S1-C subfamily serine protease
LDGTVVAGADDLVRLLTTDKIGREVLVETLRKGERRTVALTAQERPRGGRD